MLSTSPVAARHLVFVYALLALLIIAVSYLIVLEKRREQPDQWRKDGRVLQGEIRDHAKGCEDAVKELTHTLNAL